MGSELSHNYASALFGLIEDEKLYGAYRGAIEEFTSSVKENPTLRKFLESYSIPFEEKEKFVKKAFEGAPEYLASFVCLIVKKHRVPELSEIAGEFASLCNEKEGISEGIAYTGYALSKEELKRLEDSFYKRLGHKVRLKNRIEPSLLGGAKVYLDGRVYDGSLRSKLLDLEKTLLEGR